MEEIMNLGGEELNEETVMEIGKFAVLWNVFERICECDAKPDNIEKLLKIFPKKYDKHVFDNFIETIRIRAIELFGKYDDAIDLYVEQCVYPKNSDQISCVQQFFKDNKYENLLGAFLAIKRIRNNMFHGLKKKYYKEFFIAINEVLIYTLSVVRTRCISNIKEI